MAQMSSQGGSGLSESSGVAGGDSDSDDDGPPPLEDS